MSISKYVNREIQTLTEDHKLIEAAELMKNKNIGAIIITKSGQDTQSKTPIGILTDRDIVVKLIGDHDGSVDVKNISIKDCLSKELLTIKEQTGLSETIHAMKEKCVRRAPVVDEHGQLTGIVTLDDLFILLSKKLYDLSGLVEKQIG